MALGSEGKPRRKEHGRHRQTRRQLRARGDGGYPGDGGAALERLWRALPWKEIRNCPGRYTTRDADARGRTVQAPSRLVSGGEGRGEGSGSATGGAARAEARRGFQQGAARPLRPGSGRGHGIQRLPRREGPTDPHVVPESLLTLVEISLPLLWVLGSPYLSPCLQVPRAVCHRCPTGLLYSAQVFLQSITCRCSCSLCLSTLRLA